MGWFDLPPALRSRSKPAPEREGRLEESALALPCTWH